MWFAQRRSRGSYKRARLASANSRNASALAADAAQLGVWEFDIATQRIWVSDKIRQLFQFPLTGDITYSEFEQRVHPEDRRARDQVMQRAIQTQSGYETEYRILLPDGQLRWIGGRARCLPEGDGKSTRLLGVSMDITERNKLRNCFSLRPKRRLAATVLVDHTRTNRAGECACRKTIWLPA